MPVLMFPRTVTLLCGHGDVTIIVRSASVKCGLCGTVTPIASLPTQDAADLAVRTENEMEWLNEKMCATCGHSESRHQTAGGFCKHCPCIEFVDHTTSAKPLTQAVSRLSCQKIAP